MKNYQKIFSLLFLVSLFGFAGINVFSQHKQISKDISAVETPKNMLSLPEYTASIDSILVDNLVGGHFWNETYGAVYKALGKNEENNFIYVRDKTNILNFADFENKIDTDAIKLAERVRKLSDYVSENGTKVIFLLYPSRFEYTDDNGYYGIPYRDYNQHADEFIRYLRRLNIDYIDYREIFDEDGLSKTDIMYATDHHWKLETGFYATQILVEHIKDKYGIDMDPNHIYTNLDNYVTETYFNRYLGSIGREAGEIYAGLEDYTYFIPRFETEFERMYEDNAGHKETITGSFSHTIMKRKYLMLDDAYEREFFNSYLGGIYRIERITNMKNLDGPRVMFLRDSYSTPVGTFLSTMCSKLEMYWSQYCSSNYLIEKIDNMEPNLIIIGFAPDKIQSSEFTFFDIEEEEATE